MEAARLSTTVVLDACAPPTDDEWHLRKTNWCGEPAEILGDADAPLNEYQIHDGDLLLLETGKLPPKVDFLSLEIFDRKHTITPQCTNIFLSCAREFFSSSSHSSGPSPRVAW